MYAIYLISYPTSKTDMLFTLKPLYHDALVVNLLTNINRPRYFVMSNYHRVILTARVSMDLDVSGL